MTDTTPARLDELERRLRRLADCDARAGEPLGRCMREAAAAIAALRQERDQLRERLAQINMALTGQYEWDPELDLIEVIEEMKEQAMAPVEDAPDDIPDYLPSEERGHRRAVQLADEIRAEAVEVVRPFAEFEWEIPDEMADEAHALSWGNLRVGDCRRARAFLDKHAPTSEPVQGPFVEDDLPGGNE